MRHFPYNSLHLNLFGHHLFFSRKYSVLGHCISQSSLEQWFSTFLMLQTFHTVSHVMTLTRKLFLLLIHNCNFATIMKII